MDFKSDTSKNLTLEEQLGWMDWLEYVRVKMAKDGGDAELIPFDKVHQEMREAARRAVMNIPNCTQPPFRLELALKSIYDTEALGYLPWVKRVGGKTILAETENIVDTNHFLTAFFSINNR